MNKKSKRSSKTSTPMWKTLDVDLYRNIFVKAGLRRLSYRWYPRNEALKEARLERGIYKCNACKGSFPKKGIQLDHVLPVIDPSTGFTTWDAFIHRLLPGRSGWQVLCRDCHKGKSGRENSKRRAVRTSKATRGKVA